MNLFPWVRYRNKKHNLPHYQTEKELITIEYDRGWVEHALQTSDIYFYRMDQAMLNERRTMASVLLRECWTGVLEQERGSPGQAQIALIKHLTDIRSQKPFDMPLFVDWSEKERFTCGTNRFAAEMLCGTGADMIPVFFFTEKGPRPEELSRATAINSTHQAELISGMHKVDYHLGFSQKARPLVVNTVINDKYTDVRNFDEEGVPIFEFWEKFKSEGKINLRIHCNQQIKELIRFNTDVWQVDFEFAPMLGFSFGEILAQFNKPNYRGLNLYVYDITEPLYLTYLLPFGHANNVWYHTLNKKIQLVDLTRGPASACWPIVAMTDFVK